MLSRKSVDIPLLTIVSIQADHVDDEIEIHYRSGDEVKEETLHMANPDVRNEAYQQLKAAFGDKFSETEHNYSIPRAAFGSLAALTTFGLLTWGGAKFAAALRAAEDYEISGSRQGLKALVAGILEFIGPIGVYVVGGLICAMGALTLFTRVTKPQQMLILQEEPYKPGSKIALALKYMALFFVWYVVARIVM